MNSKFRFLEHTADVKFQAFGSTLGKAFENAALAMFAHMYNGKVRGKIKKKIKVSGKDYEALLYNFLEELLFLLDTKGFLLSKSKVKINKINKANKGYELTAELVGDNIKNYKNVNLDVKAVTYNEMFVKQEEGTHGKEKKQEGKNKYTVQVVLDV